MARWKRGIRIVRIGLLALATVSMLLYAASFRGVWWVSRSGSVIGAYRRTLCLLYYEPGAVAGSIPRGWRLGDLSGMSVTLRQSGSVMVQREYWFVFSLARYGPASATPWLHELVIMLYPLRLAMVTGGLGLGLLFVPTRSHGMGACAACGYDLTGLNVIAPCPECGAGPRPISARAR